MKNKKANYADVVEWIKVSFMLFFVIGIVLVVTYKFDEGIQATNDTVVPTQVKTASSSYTSYLPVAYDMAFLFVFLSFFIFSVVAARFIPSSPKFIIITIIALIFLPLGAMLIENVWDGWAQQATISTIVTGRMNIMPYMLDHLTLVVLFYSAAIAISLLTKDKGGET